MTELNKNDWIIKADKSIKDVLANALRTEKNGSWDENQITTNALNAIGSLGKILKWESQNQSTIWESYKQKGKAETASGDILIFIKVILSREVEIEGVVYYEAKKMYLNNRLEPTGYEAVKSTQLAVLMQHSAASNILLYDIKQTLRANGVDKELKCGSSAFPTAFADSLYNGPNGFSDNDSKDLPDLGKVWANFLADNFSGFGLDYSPNTVSIAKKFISNKYPVYPGHIIIGTTSKVPEIEPELDHGFISFDLYEPVISPENNPEPPENNPEPPENNPPTLNRKKRGPGKP